MKSTEFITEGTLQDLANEYNISDENIEKMASIAFNAKLNLTIIRPLIQISQECQPFLRQVGVDNCFNLFRGISNAPSSIVHKRVRLDKRKTKAMSPKLADNINKYFTDMYGAPFRNAMLCTGDGRHARKFGRLFYVFPVGDFKFLWNEAVDDFNFAFNNFRKSDAMQGVKHPFGADFVEYHTRFLKYITEIDWHSIDLKSAMHSDAEIMIRCNSYYGINVNQNVDQKDAMIEILKVAI